MQPIHADNAFMHAQTFVEFIGRSFDNTRACRGTLNLPA